MMRLAKPGAIIENSIRAELLREALAGIGPVDTLLDLGCADRPYRSIYNSFCQRAIGADLPDSPFVKRDVDILCPAEEISRHLEKQSIDIVLSTEVLHDIADPDRFFREVHTVLRPGGHLLMTTPFMVPICDGDYDHYRFTPTALRYLCERNGFEVLTIEPVANLFGTLIQFAAKPQLKVWNRLARFLRIQAVCSIWNPFILVFVVLPQAVYLACRHMARLVPALGRAGRAFDYGATGFVTHARKSVDA